MAFAFPRFVIAGGLNTLLTYLLYLILLQIMPYFWAYSVTYIVGIGFGYLINTLWVFKRQPSLRTAMAYPLTYGLNYLLGAALLWLLVEGAGIPKAAAPLIIVAVSVPVMYLITRTIFRSRPVREAEIDNR